MELTLGACVHAYVGTSLRCFFRTCVRVCARVCACVYVCARVCACVRVCVHAYLTVHAQRHQSDFSLLRPGLR